MAALLETDALLRQASITKAQGETPDGVLQGYDTIPACDDDDDGDSGVTATGFETSWKNETKILARYASPLIITYILQYSYSLVTVVVAGRLGTSELAAASLASMTANITGLVVYEGLATSLDTLTSQAFGAGKKQLVGLHVQRAIALSLLVTIPIGAVWICSPWILAKLVPETKVAHLAGDFLRFYLIGVPGYGVFEAVKRFTQAQGDFMGPMVTAMICAPLNVFWNWLLVFVSHLSCLATRDLADYKQRAGLGFRGAGIAISISTLTQPIVFLLYVRMFAPDALQCWPGFNLRSVFRNWGPMIALSVPGVLTMLTEWLAFDILTFSSSYLSEEHLAAQSVLMTISVMMYHIPFPTSIAASTRFGNLIGLGDLIAARIAFNTYYVIFLGIGTFDILLLTSMRHVIARVMTDDPVVRKYIVGVLPIVAAAQLFDAVGSLSNALTRGLGRQRIAGWVNVGVYYFFGVPLSFLLTFGPPRLELAGLWTGPLIGLGLTGSALYVYMRYADWGKAVEDARDREEF